MTEPRLLPGVTAPPMSYEHHCRVLGDPPTAGRVAHLPEEIARAGLRGRGGGAFPMAVKLQAVTRARGTPVLIANGCEGEPMSAKDRLLLSCAPHLVLDGALAVARAIRADELIVAVDELNVIAGETLKWALAQRPELRAGRIRARVEWVPGGYVTGHESAIVHWCNDGAAKPMSVPPRVTERGVGRRPSLVANVETLAHVALIARRGADWFRQAGTDEDPGTLLVTVSGAVRHPNVYEAAYGERLGALLSAAGGVTETPRALLIGGFAGGWIDAGEARLARLSRRDLERFGLRPGAGVVVVLPQSACPVAEVAGTAQWLAGQSAGQCGPCVHGLAAIAAALAGVQAGTAEPDALNRIARWCRQVAGRGACAHPDGTAGFVASALRVFADKLLDHARHGPCDACDLPPVLHLPRPGLVAA